MRALIRNGLCLVLSCWAAAAWAEEIQWRAAVRLGTPGPAAPTPTQEGPAASVQPVSFRPLVRAKTDETYKIQPLPSGDKVVTYPDKEVIKPIPSTPVAPPKSGSQAELLPLPKTSMPNTTIMPGQVVPGQVVPGQVMPGQVMPGQVMPGQVMPGQVMPGHGMPGPVIVEGESSGSVFSEWFDGTSFGGGVLGDDCCNSCSMVGPCESYGCCESVRCEPICCEPMCCGWQDCGSSCMTGCYDDGCAARGRFWANAAYLLWAFKTPNTPPLVTQSFANANPGAGILPGVVGNPGTDVIYGGDTFRNEPHSGIAFNFGFWLPGRMCCWGLDAGFFITNQPINNFTASSTGFPLLGRPAIIDGTENRQLVAGTSDNAPELPTGTSLAGTVSVNYQSQLWGLHGHVRRQLVSGPNGYLDFLIGYRHLNLVERIEIGEDLTASTGARFIILDRWHTRNVFNGPQIGLDMEYRFAERWYAQAQLRVAFGTVRQTLAISGFKNENGVVFPFGEFTAASNVGTYSSTRFAVVPEANLKIGYEITDHWRAFIGYNFLYVSSVVRPGDNINRNLVNAGVPRPAVLFQTSDFWAQGLNAGLECIY